MGGTVDLDLIRGNGRLLKAVIGSTVALKKHGAEWQGLCPFHKEKTPSFVVYQDGHFHCFGCQAHGTIFDWYMQRDHIDFLHAKELVLAAAGVSENGSDKPNGHGPAPNIDTFYEYRDADGIVVVHAVRSPPKRFWQRHPNDSGGWEAGGISNPPLYRLPALVAASRGSLVWITEGEKDADRLHDEGLIATTNIGGADGWKPEYAASFKDLLVAVLEDNDEAGRKRCRNISADLGAAGVVCKVVKLPGLGDKEDVSDWLDHGGTVEELERLGWPDNRIVTGHDFIAGHKPPVWLIDGIVQRGRLYACTSLTGHGKTAVWLFNACMIHAGKTIGQLGVFKGNVLFLAGENPADLEARMIGMARAWNLPTRHLPYVLPGGFPMTEAEADALKRDIARLGVPLALIIGDTASSFFPGDDENSNVQAGTYARTLRSFSECSGNPAVVALCHPTKGAARGNLLPRGGGAFLNELDGNLALWSDTPGEVTELHWCAKIRGPDFSALGYQLRQVPTGLIDERDRPEMTIIADPMSEEAVANHSKQALANEDVVLRALRDHPGQSLAQIARDAGWVDADDKPERWHVQRAIRSLAADKLIIQPRRGAMWELTEKGREAAEGPDGE